MDFSQCTQIAQTLRYGEAGDKVGMVLHVVKQYERITAAFLDGGTKDRGGCEEANGNGGGAALFVSVKESSEVESFLRENVASNIVISRSLDDLHRPFNHPPLMTSRPSRPSRPFHL